MRKSLLILFLFALFSGRYSEAQTVNLGVRGGIGIPNIISGGVANPLSEGYKSGFSGGGGVFTEIELNDLLSFRLGVEYSGQGGKKNGMQAMPTERLITGYVSQLGMSVGENIMAELGKLAAVLPQYVYTDIRNKVKFDYVMIPVSAQIGKNLGNDSPWRIYANAGPFVSFLMSGVQKTKGFGKLYTENDDLLWNYFPAEIKNGLKEEMPDLAKIFEDGTEFGNIDISGELRPVNFGITGNLGLAYKCARNRFFVELGGNYGFVNVQKNAVNGKNRIGAATLMIGYSYNIMK